MRVQKESSFVIHTRAYSESSLLVEMFSRHHGRITTIAKGARRPKSNFRGALLPFRRLSADWTGKGEIPILTLAEPVEPWVGARGRSLLCSFYVNELIFRLLHRYDAHPDLFDYYADTLERLRRVTDREDILRAFEKRLLKELGYAMNLSFEASGRREIVPSECYRYLPQLGVVADNDTRPGGVPVSGAALCALRDEAFANSRLRRECKTLMRAVIGHQLDNRPLHSRKLFR